MDLELEKQLYKKQKMDEVREISVYLGGLSIVFGLLYSFCLFRNPSGITYPLFVFVGYGLSILMFRKLNIRMKKGSWFLAVVSVLIAASTCRTANFSIITINHMVIFLLSCVCLIHQFYYDREWDFGKYFVSLFVFLGTTVSLVGYPFIHCMDFVKNKKAGRFGYLVAVIAGLAASVPFLFLVVVLLGQADAVFRNVVEYALDSFFNPFTVISAAVKTCFGVVVVYCLMCSGYLKNMEEDPKQGRKRNPLVAISGLSMIAVVYLIFSIIQIVYLFMGAGTLPEGITYSSYARQGFFQLVFVVCMNLVLVLACLKFFRDSRVLKGILFMINLCTFIMIASAAFRMMLYVKEYQLTFLRVLVLWFLALLSVLMAGVIILIFKNRFPLFWYSLVVISVFYLGFAWMKPDYIIARHNFSHIEEWSESDTRYLVYDLSVDAASVVAGIKDEELREYYIRTVKRYTDHMSWRKYNFSFAKADALFQK